MGKHTENALMSGLKFGWGFLDSKQREAIAAVVRIVKSIPDEKILELGKRTSKLRFDPTANKRSDIEAR